mgnify:CR=1 FL=1
MHNNMWEDIKTWSGGDDTLHGKLESSLEAMLALATNPAKVGEYNQLMDNEWLEAYLIIHYHSLMYTGEISPLVMNPDFVGRDRRIQSLVPSDPRIGENSDRGAAGYDLYLVDPHDIRNMCRKAMVMAMYFMEERHKVQTLLRDMDKEDNNGS